MKTSVLTLLLASFIVSGCGHVGRYRQDYVMLQVSQTQATLDGKALVVTESIENHKVYSEHPSSLTGSATTYEAKLGEYLRDITLAVLKRKFKGGAEESSSVPNESDYRIVIKPKILNFDYRYNQLKNLGIWITPESKIDLYVYLYDGNGTQIMEKEYKGDYISGGGYVVHFRPGEKINRAVHLAILDTVEQMVQDIESILKEKISRSGRTP